MSLSITTIDKIAKKFPKDFVCAIKYEQGTRLAFVFDDITTQLLDTLRQELPQHATTLVLRKKDILFGADVFALDFLHIITDYQIIAGIDIFKKISLTPKDVREHLEFELRSKLIGLYHKILASKTKQDHGYTLAHAQNILLPIFKGMIYIKRVSVPAHPEDIFLLVQKHYKMNVPVIEAIFRKRASHNDIEALLTWLKDTCDSVDKLTVSNK